MFRFRSSLAVSAVVVVIALTPWGSSGSIQAKEPAHVANLHFLAMQAAPAQAQNANPADQLPPGDGRDVTIRVCSQCHGVGTFAQKRNTKDQWDAVLDDMVAKGLSASDDDMNTVEKYLTTYLAPDSKDKGSSDSATPKKN